MIRNRRAAYEIFRFTSHERFQSAQTKASYSSDGTGSGHRNCVDRGYDFPRSGTSEKLLGADRAVWRFDDHQCKLPWGKIYNSDSSQEELRIDDGVVETISKIPHVEFASPILSTYVLLKQGVYEGSLTVQGMTQEALQNMDMKVGEGTLPEADAPLSFFYGNQVITRIFIIQRPMKAIGKIVKP